MLTVNDLSNVELFLHFIICFRFFFPLDFSHMVSEQVLLLMRNLAINLVSPDFEDHVSVKF